MAKNYVEDGKTLTLTAPAGGVKSGVLVAINDLVVVPLDDAPAGEKFVGHPGGVWRVPCADGLEAGAKVGVLNGSLVAADTADATPCGKLTTDAVAGFADLLLVQ